MKNILKNVLVIIILCAGFLTCMPKQVNAQADVNASNELTRLLRSARIQTVNQRIEPINFTLPFLEGESAALSAFKGKVVILNFWATWCPPCRDEMPSMEILYQRYKDNGLEMLAVNLRENINTVQQFIKTNNYTFPIPLDLDGRVSSQYGITSIPTTYIIDKDGKIIGRVVGSIHWDTPQVFALFDALLSSGN